MMMMTSTKQNDDVIDNRRMLMMTTMRQGDDVADNRRRMMTTKIRMMMLLTTEGC